MKEIGGPPPSDERGLLTGEQQGDRRFGEHPLILGGRRAWRVAPGPSCGCFSAGPGWGGAHVRAARQGILVETRGTNAWFDENALVRGEGGGEGGNDGCLDPRGAVGRGIRR
jgi:hypothetical protein